jgi:hypothetical protein
MSIGGPAARFIFRYLLRNISVLGDRLAGFCGVQDRFMTVWLNIYDSLHVTYSHAKPW